MARPKGTPKTGGRAKGVPNKVTTAAKTAIELAAEGLGGAVRLQAWAREDAQNERIFWSQIYTKLLPLQLTDGEGKPVIPPNIALLFSAIPGSDNRT